MGSQGASEDESRQQKGLPSDCKYCIVILKHNARDKSRV
jgi:hypothetical protein